MTLKILIQRADRLGDMILAFPVVEQLKAAYPNAIIHVLCSRISHDVVSTHPLVDQTLVLGPFLKTLRLLKQEKYNIILNLWHQPKTALLGALASIPIRIGDKEGLISLFYTNKVHRNWSDLSRHESDFNLDLLKPLNMTPFEKKIMFYTTQTEKENAKKLIKTAHHTEKKSILFFIGSTGSNAAIPTKVIIDMAKKILNQARYTVIFCYGDLPQGDPILSFTHPLLTNITERLPIQTLAAVIERVDYYISSDTGPTHIAAFLKKAILVYFGSKHNPPSRWGPLSDHIQIIRCDNDQTKLTSPMLYKKFQQLIASSPDPKTAQLNRLYHSYRVLKCDKKRIPIPSVKTFFYTRKATFWANLLAINYAIQRYNITNLDGDFTKLEVALIRFYYGLRSRFKPSFNTPSLTQIIQVK